GALALGELFLAPGELGLAAGELLSLVRRGAQPADGSEPAPFGAEQPHPSPELALPELELAFQPLQLALPLGDRARPFAQPPPEVLELLLVPRLVLIALQQPLRQRASTLHLFADLSVANTIKPKWGSERDAG